jgi:hypothetical protein
MFHFQNSQTARLQQMVVIKIKRICSSDIHTSRVWVYYVTKYSKLDVSKKLKKETRITGKGVYGFAAR